MRKSIFSSLGAAALLAAASAMPMAIAETMPTIPTRPRRQAKPYWPKHPHTQNKEIAAWNAKVEAKRLARKGSRA